MYSAASDDAAYDGAAYDCAMAALLHREVALWRSRIMGGGRRGLLSSGSVRRDRRRR